MVSVFRRRAGNFVFYFIFWPVHIFIPLALDTLHQQ